MPSDRADGATADVDVPTPIRRCACGRVALARCWLGESFPARWLVSCDRQSPRPLPDTPEAA
jgi:hypothetical protein